MQPHNLFVRSKGQGLPILFLHGWSLSSVSDAFDFDPVFDHALPDYLRLHIDLPGMGQSPVPQEGIPDLDSIFETVSRFVETHILPSSDQFLLVGSSCGAYLARAIAYRFANAVGGLLLRVPLVEPVTERRDLGGVFAPAVRHEGFLEGLGVTEREVLGEGIPVQTGEYAGVYKRKMEEAVLPAVAAARKEVLDPLRGDPERYRLRAKMHGTEEPFWKPTLVLTGRQDGVVGYRDAWPLMECYPRATFALIDRANHDLPVDETGLFAALVRDWLRRVEETRSLALPAQNKTTS